MVRRSTAERLAFAALIPLVASCGSRFHNPQTTPQRPPETIQTVGDAVKFLEQHAQEASSSGASTPPAAS